MNLRQETDVLERPARSGKKTGKPVPFFNPTARIQKIREDIFATPYSICLERPLLLDRFWDSAAGKRAADEHPLVRRASALAYVFSNRIPRVYPEELVIGNMTSKRVAANYYPEGGSVNILLDIHRLGKRQIPLELSYMEQLRLLSVGLKNIWGSVGGKALLRWGRLSHFLDFFFAKRYFITEEAGIAHQVGDYHMVVHQGLRHPHERARACLTRGTLEDGTPLSPDQIAFFRSICITIAGIRQMAHRLADEAERIAFTPGASPERRQELLTLADACRRVPFEPARTFQEGLQACWMVHIAMNLEDFEQGVSFGRLDQILYPLYRKDLEQGRLTPEKAVEIIASFGLKTCETMPLYAQRIDRFFSGNGVAQGITLGGTGMDGRDATNELSGLFLNGYAQIRTREPALHVRIHKGTPDWFLDKAVEVVQLGCGKPSFFGDGAVTKALEHAGISTAHARDYAVIGCVEMASQGRTYNSSDAALFNLPLCLELALNQGKRLMENPKKAGRMGAATPPAGKMKTFEDVLAAFRTQVEDAVDVMAQVISWLEETYRIWRPTPVNSILTQGCLESGRDVTWGGACYDFTSIQAAGLADAGDSLLALKKLVFEEGRFSLEELVEILRRNFAGHESLRLELINRFPRYGNNDPEADRMTQIAADIFADAITRRRNTRGGKYIAGIYSMTCHIGFGRITGALPNGRLAGQSLSNGLSPVDGMERRGPTAVLQSAAALDSTNWANCCALNLKFDKRLVQGKAGKKALASMFKTFFGNGGMQVQVNVLDPEVLKEAKADPSLHPGLVVRVAGYCAYFNDLQPDVQDEIIARTEHGAG